MTQQLKKLYGKYFQKSKSFLYPVLGINKDTMYPPIQSYMAWEDKYSVTDHKLILSYHVRNQENSWNSYLLNTLMNNKFFHEYHEVSDQNLAISFDLSLISEDYQKVLFGRYSKLSKMLKSKIREFYSYNSPEWAYMESFLYPAKYVPIYSRLLDVDEKHILHTGELCNKPNIDLETFKTKPHATNNDADQHQMEPIKNFQTDSD